MRHAKSSWSDATLSDRERPLANRGRRAARKMGRRLAKHAARPDLMLSSPAVRALKTARIMARKLHYPRRQIAVDDGLYACTVTDMLHIVRALGDRYRRVMVFGHDPQITGLARHFSFGIRHMPTGAVACFMFDTDTWTDVSPGILTHVKFDSPKRDHL